MKRDDQNLEPLDAILRRASALSPGPATPQCADPELLAAYYDRSLVQPERDRLEAHFADCARCQMQLVAIARAGEAGSTDIRSGVRPHFAVSWLQQRWRIAIPALAAAAALLIVVRAMRSSDDEFRRDHLIAMAKHEAPLADLAARAPAAASPPAVASAPAAPSSSELAMNEVKPAAPRMPEHREELASEYRAKSVDRAGAIASGKLAKSFAVAGAASAPAVKAESAEVPAERPRAELQMSESAAGLRDQQAQQTTNPPAVGAYGGAASAVAGLAMSAPAAAPEPLVTISPPGRTSTWMIGKRGMILMRDAAGKTHPQHSGVETDLTAGAAPSPTVCWIVGRDGTILRTTDGETWTKIASPTDADLTSVAADSAQHAAVTTATGQNFATTDGGTSWHRW